MRSGGFEPPPYSAPLLRRRCIPVPPRAHDWCLTAPMHTSPFLVLEAVLNIGGTAGNRTQSGWVTATGAKPLHFGPIKFGSQGWNLTNLSAFRARRPNNRRPGSKSLCYLTSPELTGGSRPKTFTYKTRYVILAPTTGLAPARSWLTTRYLDSSTSSEWRPQRELNPFLHRDRVSCAPVHYGAS